MIGLTDTVVQIFLVFIRASALFFAIPVFAGRVVPRQLRIAFAFVLAIVLTPLINFNNVNPTSFIGLTACALVELIVGVMMAFAIRMIFFIIEFAGQMISTEIGLTMGSEINPLVDTSTSSISNLIFYFAIVLFFIGGFQYSMLAAFMRSFSVVEPGSFIIGRLSVLSLVKASSEIFSVGLQIAAPIIAINFLVNLIFSVLGKVVPRMNVFILSFSVRILVGFGILLSVVGLIAHYIVLHMKEGPENMLQFIK